MKCAGFPSVPEDADIKSFDIVEMLRTRYSSVRVLSVQL